MTGTLSRAVVCGVLSLFIALDARAAAAQAIAPAMLANLKAATGFVKVKRRELEWTGSGFVVKKNKDSVLVVTNAHVLEPPKIDDADLPKDLPRETMELIFRLQKEVSGVESVASVVFFSGTPEERTLPAQVLAKDRSADLAVLKVSGAPDTAKPIGINTQKLAETTPLIALGFPFGGLFSVGKGNPTITISRAELTSFKPISAEVTWLQLQGALNPGSSGGPVVDAAGKLCGVQVAVIRGSGLGFAIPVDQLTRMMRGRLSKWRMAAKKSGDEEVEVEYRAWAIDPVKKIQTAAVSYVVGEVPVAPLADFKAAPSALSGAKSVELKRQGFWTLGKFKVPVSASGPLVVTVQPTWTDAAKKVHLGCPEVVRVSLGPGGPVSSNDGRTFWRYIDPKKGEGWFEKTKDGWDEEDDGATHHFAEAGRNADVVELFDAQRKIGVRLSHDSLRFKFSKKKDWIRLYSGAWEASGNIVAAE